MWRPNFGSVCPFGHPPRQTWNFFALKLKPKQLENWTVREFMPFAPNGWLFNGNHPLSPHCWRKNWPRLFRLMMHRKTKLITAHRNLGYSYIKLLHFQWLNVDPSAILTKFDEICQCEPLLKRLLYGRCGPGCTRCQTILEENECVKNGWSCRVWYVVVFSLLNISVI